MTKRVVLVTGGTRGIGRGIAHAFARTGATVVTCGRRDPRHDDPFTFLQADLRRWEEVDRVLRHTVELHGRLDVVVNNAGGAPPVDAATATPSFHEKVIQLNLIAPLHVAQSAYGVMAHQIGGGVIVNVASVAAGRASPTVAAYAAAKAGLVNLTKTLAVEWAPSVRVVCVSPGLVWTEAADAFYADGGDAIAASVPLGRFGTPDEIGRAAVWLASDDAAYVSGAELVLDGGGERPAWLIAKEQG